MTMKITMIMFRNSTHSPYIYIHMYSLHAHLRTHCFIYIIIIIYLWWFSTCPALMGSPGRHRGPCWWLRRGSGSLAGRCGDAHGAAGGADVEESSARCQQIPSGNSSGKSPALIGKSGCKVGPFSIAMFNYQRLCPGSWEWSISGWFAAISGHFMWYDIYS